MSEHAEIRNLMLADAGIAGALTSSVYYMRLPQDFKTGTAVVLNATGGIPEQLYARGVSASKSVDLQVNLFSDSTIDLYDLKSTVIEFFNTLYGTAGTEYVLNVNTFEEISTEYNEDTELYRSIFQLTIQMRN